MPVICPSVCRIKLLMAARLMIHVGACLQVESRLVQGLLAVIERERCGESVDRALLASLLRCLNDLGIYINAFQVSFLLSSHTLCLMAWCEDRCCC